MKSKQLCHFRRLSGTWTPRLKAERYYLGMFGQRVGTRLFTGESTPKEKRDREEDTTSSGVQEVAGEDEEEVL